MWISASITVTHFLLVLESQTGWKSRVQNSVAMAIIHMSKYKRIPSVLYKTLGKGFVLSQPQYLSSPSWFLSLNIFQQGHLIMIIVRNSIALYLIHRASTDGALKPSHNYLIIFLWSCIAFELFFVNTVFLLQDQAFLNFFLVSVHSAQSLMTFVLSLRLNLIKIGYSP